MIEFYQNTEIKSGIVIPKDITKQQLKSVCFNVTEMILQKLVESRFLVKYTSPKPNDRFITNYREKTVPLFVAVDENEFHKLRHFSNEAIIQVTQDGEFIHPSITAQRIINKIILHYKTQIEELD